MKQHLSVTKNRDIVLCIYKSYTRCSSTLHSGASHCAVLQHCKLYFEITLKSTGIHKNEMKVVCINI
jgi:hypothetical protein